MYVCTVGLSDFVFNFVNVRLHNLLLSVQLLFDYSGSGFFS